ncbi:MAG: DUF1343 domain-containing protein [Gemmatimonadaceae bacterium]|nr:DUF1343 domain-containing protein [Gemmatimonadaceae bacterium]
MAPVVFGVDRVVAEPGLLRGAKRIGLLTNDAVRLATDPATTSRVALHAAGLSIVRLFSPEHGISAHGTDGAPMTDGTDALTGLPVTSLYGDRFAPTVESLGCLDLLLVDLPDIGARCYTYAWTMTHALDACAARGTPVIVLDRPNPLGGVLADAEGPMLDLAHASFLGRLDIPVRHSLTIGELARLWQRERAPHVQLDVIACPGWERRMQWPDTGIPFTPTSPDMRSFESALCYPGTSLFEGTHVSVGRGSEAAFRRLSAPWLDAAKVAAECARAPTLAGVLVTGEGNVLSITVSDRRCVRPVAVGMTLVSMIASHHPTEFQWADYPTAANPSGGHHVERLAGTGLVRQHVDRGEPIPMELLRCDGWTERVRSILLYS